MACNCGSKAKGAATTWTVTTKAGVSTSYRSEVEALSAQRRQPGSTVSAK
jgi:hypothetical protein